MQKAIMNPLLDNVSMKGAKGVLLNITGGSDMTLYEIDETVNRISPKWMRKQTLFLDQHLMNLFKEASGYQ